MADNTRVTNQPESVNPDYTVRDIDKGSGVKTPVVVIDKGGEGAESLVTENNPLPVSVEGSYQNSTSTSYESSRVIKGSAGKLYGVSGYNSNSSQQFIQIHNSSNVPADSSIPVITFTVPGGSPFSIDFGPVGRSFSNGIVVCNSSTGPLKTIGSNDCWFDAQYV